MSNLPAGGSRSEHTTPQLSPTTQYPPMQPPYRSSPRLGPALNLPVSLPPLQHISGSTTPSTPSADRRQGNAFGFQSILNPQGDLVEQQRGRRRSASQMESPSPIDTQHSQSLPSISRPNSVDSTQDDPRSKPFQAPDKYISDRRLLSPESSKLHRTKSLGLLNPPTGTIDAHQQPFLTAHIRPSDTGSHQPPFPTPPAAGPRPNYFPPLPHGAPTPPPNMMRPEPVRRPSVGFPQSGSASPIGQYSPYSQAASVASSQYDSQSAPGPFAHGHGSNQGHDSRHGSIPMETERNSMIPMTNISQSSIQLMTIKSQGGHPVQIPVDVQAASKVADEKRRRNAGASARFRARRKEKEREASISISRLEQQLRFAEEDADYYRAERDFFKSIIMQQPNPERYFARPQSPRLRRHSGAMSHAPSSTTGPGSDGGSYGDYEEDTRESDRNVRRRTSSYHPATGPSMPESAPPNTVTHAYANTAFPPMNLTSEQKGSHELQYSSHQQASLPSLQHHNSEQPIYRDPFQANQNVRHDNRPWPAAPNDLRRD